MMRPNVVCPVFSTAGGNARRSSQAPARDIPNSKFQMPLFLSRRAAVRADRSPRVPAVRGGHPRGHDIFSGIESTCIENVSRIRFVKGAVVIGWLQVLGIPAAVTGLADTPVLFQTP